jgi:hypothetical protein
LNPERVFLNFGPYAVAPSVTGMDLETQFRGFCHRGLRRTPVVDADFWQIFLVDARLRCRCNFDPIDFHDNLFWHWLKTSKYNQNQRAELVLTEHEYPDLDSPPWNAFVHSCFTKLEATDTGRDGAIEKHGRAIYGCSPWIKSQVSPVVHYCEQLVFKSIDKDQGFTPFIKLIPDRLRPSFIRQHLTLPYVYVTDHTAFEAHIHNRASSLECELFDHLTRNMPNRRKFMKVIRKLLCGKKIAKFNEFKVKFKGGRMSGDPSTSLGNGYINWQLICFLAKCFNVDCQKIVEGDDGVFCTSEPINLKIANEIFALLGFTIKISEAHDVETAGFISNYLTEDDYIIRDPVEPMCRNWSFLNGSGDSLKSLLRAKGLSMKYMYIGCPILGVFAQRMIDLTEGHVARFDSRSSYRDHHVLEHIRQFGEESLAKEPLRILPSARMQMWSLFGYDESLQLQMESDLSRAGFGYFKFDWDWIFPTAWCNYHDQYSLDRVAGQTRDVTTTYHNNYELLPDILNELRLR